MSLLAFNLKLCDCYSDIFRYLSSFVVVVQVIGSLTAGEILFLYIEQSWSGKG